MNLLIQPDLNKTYPQAIQSYENGLVNTPTSSPEIYSNLAFIYWAIAADYIFVDDHNIPEELSLIAGQKYLETLQKGLQVHPKSIELHFWKRYFADRFQETEFTEEDCERLFQEYENDSMIPYFFLYLFDEEKYKEKAQELLVLCKELPTAKHLYIKTFLSNLE